MKKKNTSKGGLNTNVLRMYLMGASNPSNSNKVFSVSSDIIDLHLEKAAVSEKNISPAEALFIQLEQLEKSIDTAIVANKHELRVIHGIGKGKLKEAIHKALAKHPHVSDYENDYHPRYGWGSTLIRLRW